MKIKRSRNKKLFVFLTVLIVLIAAGGYYLYLQRPNSKPTNSHSSTQQEPASKETNEFDKNAHSIDSPGSLWWIVNKKRPLPDNYVPPELVTPQVTINSKKSAAENTLRPEAASALEKMFADAKKVGVDYMLASGYRSIQLQTTYYNNLVAANGQAEADRVSAKPGTSEHQTGLSLDVARADRKLYLEQAFGQDPGGKWLADHAHEYGYIIRYPKGKESSTGYDYEPWHIRYVGVELANELYKKQQTMEEFFAI